MPHTEGEAQIEAYTQDNKWNGNVRRVLEEILVERRRQHVKFGGTQTHTLATWFLILGEEYGEACKDGLESGLADLATEVAHLSACRTELVQVAAVATAMVEAIDREGVDIL